MKIFTLCLVLCFLLICSTAAFATNQTAIVAPNDFATKTGERILRKGGTAADAAIAMALVLSVTEPHLTGLGGGGFLIYFEKARNQFVFVDYLEQAPFLSSEELEEYKRTATLADSKNRAKTGIFSIAVPGFLRGMEKIHQRFGELPWADLFDDAIKLSENGVLASHNMIIEVGNQNARLGEQKSFRENYSKANRQKELLLKQVGLANTLQLVSKNGANVFYTGDIGREMLKELNAAGNKMDEEDLRRYTVYFRAPKKIFWGKQIVIGPSFPGNGMPLLEQLLLDSQAQKITSSDQNWTQFIESEMKAFTKIQPPASQTNSVSTPADAKDDNLMPDAKNEGTAVQSLMGHTTHICVVDRHGNIASMSNSLNDPFGSGIVLSGQGMIMNNGMEGYQFLSNDMARDQIRRRERPVSDMTPLIVLSGLQPDLVIGTSGGQTIPLNLFQILFLHYLQNTPLAAAIKAPKFYSFPKVKLNFFETGFSVKLIGPQLDFKPKGFPGVVGDVQAILLTAGATKTFSDWRGVGTGKVITGKLKNAD